MKELEHISGQSDWHNYSKDEACYLTGDQQLYFMFEQILQPVKEHLNSNPHITSEIPKDQEEAIHQEIATHISNG